MKAAKQSHQKLLWYEWKGRVACFVTTHACTHARLPTWYQSSMSSLSPSHAFPPIPALSLGAGSGWVHGGDKKMKKQPQEYESY